MTIISFISSIKNILPEADWPWVFSALSFDPLVWENLGDELGQRALDRNPSRSEDFSPAALALLALDMETSLENLRATPLQEIPLENSPEEKSISTLAQAGWVALQLRDARRKNTSWEVILHQKTKVSPTILACLYAMIPDPADFLRAAFGLDAEDAARPGVNPALRALLSNPLTPQAHIEALGELLSDLPRSERLTLLSQVQRSRPDLAPPLALATLHREPPIVGNLPAGSVDRFSVIGQIEKMLRAARLHRLAEDLAQALSSLNDASVASRRLQGELSAQIAQLTAQKDGSEASLPAWEQALQLDPDSPDHLAGLTSTLLDTGRIAEAESRLANPSFETPHAGIQLVKARLAFLHDNKESARQFALQALEIGTNSLTQTYAAPELACMLLQLDCPIEAAAAAELALRQRPNSPALLALLARARLSAGQPSQAVQAAHLAAALQPQNLELRRLLAECLELAGEWHAALQERTALLERSETSSPEDLRDLAACSLYAGQAVQAAQICQQLIQQDENDGQTWTLLGQATAEMGDAATALENLQQGTQLSPEHSAPWLALSHLYDDLGQREKALETLQAAALAALDLPEIHLALGEAYLAQGAPTQALSVLRVAASLAAEQPESKALSKASAYPRSLPDQIALRLGQTLHQLGHLTEARQSLEQAFQRAPADVDIARCYAQILLDMGELRLAVDPLKAVLQSRPRDPAPYLDYARSVLKLHAQQELDISIEDAIKALQRVLEMAPETSQATALLAEALAANEDLLPAMEAYRQALESDLAQEPEWQARLSLGLGEVAHKLGQIETAIAALQDASQADPTDAHIQRSLSEAYDAAGLCEDAFQAARSALLLAPGDVDNLNWFAIQSLNLKNRPGISLPETRAEAIDALERATRLAPQRGDLWVSLAQVQLDAGNQAAALEALMNLAEPDGPVTSSNTTALYQAAQGLMQLGEADAAVRCLERALQNGPNGGAANGPSLLELLTALSTARYQAGSLQAALEAMDQAIALNPDEATLHLEKANMLLELGHEEPDTRSAHTNAREALASLVTAMRLNPNDPDLHRRAALIHRAAGDLPTAMAYADRMVELSITVSEAMSARALAADLALSMLQPTQARAYLDGPLPPSEPAEPIEDAILFNYYALRAETALEAGDERGAIEELVRVLEISPDDPRLLAIHARIIHHREDPQAATDILENVLGAIGDPTNADINLIRSTAQAALEMSQWEVALKLYGQTVKAAPTEPRSHLDLARTLVLRAEFNGLCKALDAIRRAAEPQALSEESQHSFDLALLKAEELFRNWETVSNKLEVNQGEEAGARLLNKWSDPLAQIQRWRMRGQAIFQPSREAAQSLASLQPHPDDTAARVACLREMGDLAAAGFAARDYPQHPFVLLQLALTLMDEKPRQAMAAIHAAADVLSMPSANRRQGSAFCSREISPLVYALMATLFHRNGNRASDRESALHAILNALSVWRDEPRWHALAAEIYLAGEPGDEESDLEAAISHLEQAIKFDPANTASLLILGQIHLRGGSAQKAAQTFEQAAEAAPDDPETWIWLAKAYRSLGDLELAAAHAERAVTLAPSQVKPLLLRGEIALQANNPRGAQSRAQAALRIQPDDPDALLILARALNELDRPEEALATLEKALPLAAEPLALSLEKVRLLRRAHGADAALQAAQTLADHNPEEPRVLALQAELLESSGQIEAAIRAAQRALRGLGFSTALPNIEQARLHHLLGRMMRRSGQLDQAVHHLSETIRLAPDMVDAYLEIGHVHHERRQHNQALNAYRQAITVAPHDHRAYYMIGLALKETKDYLGAEKMLRRAADLAPNDVSIHRLLGAVVALNLVHNRREINREAERPL